MVDLIAQALGAILLGLFMAWLARSVPPKAQVTAGKRLLSYSRRMKWLGVGSLLFWVSLILLMLTTTTEDVTMPLVIFGVFLLLSLYLTLEAYFLWVLYDEDYIYCYAPWRKARQVAWYDIKAIKFSPISYYFICSTTYSGKIRLSVYLSGVQEFLQEAERRGIPCPSSAVLRNL